MIDVLRATTTLTVALAHGAVGVLVASSPEEARTIRERTPGALLCGERGGRVIPGFDLGNSPAEYAPERVHGRTLVFASSNGSVALHGARGARARVLGAFVNASAVVERVARERRLELRCAGADGGFCLEDAACAAWIAVRLSERGARLEGPEARLAASIAPRSEAEIRTLVEGSDHARELRELGAEYARDVSFCATLDSLSVAFALPSD